MYTEITFNNVTDFLTQIKTLSVAEGWTVVVEDLAELTVLKKLYLKNPQNDMVVFIEYDTNRTSSYRLDYKQRLYVNVASDYDSNASISQQPDAAFISNNKYQFSIYENLLSRSFVSITNNKIMFINRQAGLYLPLYLGKYLAYASPLQNTTPFIIYGGRSSSTSSIFYSTSLPNSGFEIFSARFQGANVGAGVGTAGGGIVYPYGNKVNDFANTNNIGTVYKTSDKMMISDIELFSNKSGIIGALGSLEGVYAISRNNVSPEFVFSIDTMDYITFNSEGQAQLSFAIKKQ